MDFSFRHRFVAIAEAMRWSAPPTPEEALTSWEQFVLECVDGFPSGYFEYSHDIAVRSLLQAALDDSEIVQSPDHERFCAAVESIDVRFRAVLDSGMVVAADSTRWWLERIPGFGSPDYVADVFELFGRNATESW
jgi:hypothetical protein